MDFVELGFRYHCGVHGNHSKIESLEFKQGIILLIQKPVFQP